VEDARGSRQVAPIIIPPRVEFNLRNILLGSRSSLEKPVSKGGFLDRYRDIADGGPNFP
jgi:hypothetical protein